MDTCGLTTRLVGICRRHWLLRRFLDPLYAHAGRRGYKVLIREDALRLLERAHVERLGEGGGDGRGTAEAALDRFERLAALGDAEAAWHVAEAHRTGFGRPRHHWKALEHFGRAQALGHPGAAERLRQLKEGEAIPDEDFHAFGRQAMVRAAFREEGGERRARAARAWLHEARREGLGLRTARVVLGCALLLALYVVLDFSFFGLGAWRPDPTRVAWGIVGKIHPPKDGEAGRVLPGWLRPDASSVAFHVSDFSGERSGSFTVGGLRGRVVYLQVVDGRHPMVAESVAYFRALSYRRDLVYVHLYLPGLERESDVTQGLQMATDIPAAFPENRRAVRPLGSITVFPMNFILDRRGRIRQRWAGWSRERSEAALAGALAEAP